MNYQKIYENLINNAKLKNRVKLKKNDKNYVYYENHHIIPKCLGGDNDKNNLVLLTGREHYICHKLLVMIYPTNKKIIDAFHRMTYDKQGNRNISSRDYDYAKYLKSSTPISEETKNKMKKHIFTEEHKRKLSESHKGLKYENRILPWENDSSLNPFFGKKHTEAAKKKMSESAKKRKFSTKGMIRITNGVENTTINKESNIPKNWWRGQTRNKNNIML